MAIPETVGGREGRGVSFFVIVVVVVVHSNNTVGGPGGMLQ